MKKYQSFEDWIESQSINPYVVVCLSLDGDINYVEDFETLAEYKADVKKNIITYDGKVEEEPEKLPEPDANGDYFASAVR